MYFKKAGFFSILFLFISFIAVTRDAVSSSSSAPHTSQVRLTALPLDLALARSRQIGQVSYQLWFKLEGEQTSYEGKSIIRFDLKPKAIEQGDKIFVDLEEGQIKTLTLNGTELNDFNDPERFDGHRIYFKLKELRPTSNQVEIGFSHPYSTNGNALYRFKDPADGKVYLYSNFEPYNAHRMFPCFDQPDLKASYELKVEAPADWHVIANTLPETVTVVNHNKVWVFPPTAHFSTYLFALHAGPYASWSNGTEGTEDAKGIPLRLFARQSLAQYVEHREWLDITKRGLDFYGVQFGIPYPFKKYDQIIVPDFNSGAMENVGAVTFSERYVYRTRVPHDLHLKRADTILHEMAHMWFGDLVTMKWWNGLWLNESFASFMSSWALHEATPFTDSWQMFFTIFKQWGYFEDQLVTSHPIELPVMDTEQAQANFDGITYGKGASVLKQLKFYLGEDDFREGLQRYFQKYAYKNTTLGEFMRMLSEASNQDLNTWQHAWLQTSGLNTLQAEWECEIDPETQKSKISKFNLLQKDGNELRAHRTQVALFQSKSKSGNPLLTKSESFDVTYSTASTPVPAAIGKACPDFVFPNYGDNDYVKVEFDSHSFKEVTQKISHIDDPLVRQIAWHTLWEMVLNGQLSPLDYANIAIKHIKNEKDTKILTTVLKTLGRRSLYFISVLRFLNPDKRNRFLTELNTFVKSHLLAASPGSDLQMIWYNAFAEIASGPSAIHFAKALLDGKQKLTGFRMDQDRRWQLLQALAVNHVADIDQLLQVEIKKDRTDLGQKLAIATQVVIPDADIKKNWLKQIAEPAPTSGAPAEGMTAPPIASNSQSQQFKDPLQNGLFTIAQLRSAIENYQVVGQEKFIESSVDSYFENLPKIALSSSRENEVYAVWFARFMFPSLCEQSIIDRVTKTLETYPDLPVGVTRTLKVNRQIEEWCIRARQL